MRNLQRIRGGFRVGCPFCYAWVAPPTNMQNVFSGSGCLGGRCDCGAAYVADPTGRSGGQALLDAQALVCEGDLDRAIKLQTDVDVEVDTRPYQGKASAQIGRRTLKQQAANIGGPQVWFVKLKTTE